VLASIGGSSQALDPALADGLASPLALPQATALHRVLRSDSLLQQRLLQALLPALVTPLTAAQRDEMDPSTLPRCLDVVLSLTPDAIAVHMATPAGLRSLQEASQQLLQLQQELKEQRRQQRRQRQAAAAGQQAGEGEQQVASPAYEARLSNCSTALHPLARVWLFAALAAVALQAAASNSERKAVICSILAHTFPAVAAAVQVAAKALPQLGHEAWSHAGQALQALAQALYAAEQNDAMLSQRGFDSAATALLAAVQLRALLCGLKGSWSTWQQQQQQRGVAADRAVSQHTDDAAKAVERYCSCLAGQLGTLIAEQTMPAELQATGWPVRAAVPTAAGGAAADTAADSSSRRAAVAGAHAAWASLLHLLVSKDGEQWDSGLVLGLNLLHWSAGLLRHALCRSG